MGDWYILVEYLLCFCVQHELDASIMLLDNFLTKQIELHIPEKSFNLTTTLLNSVEDFVDGWLTSVRIKIHSSIESHIM